MNSDRAQEIVRETLSAHATSDGGVLLALQELQERLGYIPHETLRSVDEALGVPQGEAAAVLSFYHELRTSPPARHHIRVCQGDSCAAVGSRHLSRALEEHLGTSPGEVSAEGHVCHDKVYCLGNCALSPSVSIDGEVRGRVTPESLLRLLEELDRD